MRHVPIAEFKDKLSEVVAAAEAGEEIVITRHGRPAVKLIAALASDDEKRAARIAALEQLQSLREKLRAEGRTATIEEMIEWKNEGRR